MMKSLDLRNRAMIVREQLQTHYVQSPHDWVDVALSTNGAVTITIVSTRFYGLPNAKRESQVQQIWQATTDGNLDLMWMTLATPEEAESMGIMPPNKSDFVGSWLDFAYSTLNHTESTQREKRQGTTRVVVFYSYKGGVGRTTAMLHVAYLLARQGKRIALVDMDLEAPGLQYAVEDLDRPVEHGLVDYLYERQLLTEGIPCAIGIHDIIYQVRSSLPMKGDLFVIPAGRVNLNYISMVDDLDSRLGNSGLQAWQTFVDDLTAERHPDLIFVDSRTGFNRWGAISLLMLADEAFVFAYPNRQNLEGLSPLLESLKTFGRPPITLVFSMVPTGEQGQRMVEDAWEQTAHLIALPDDPWAGKATLRGRPVVVYYSPTVATSSHLPLEDTAAYRPLAAKLGEVATEASNNDFIDRHGLGLGRAQRLIFINSIRIPVPFAERDFDSSLFQPIEVLPRILDPEVCVIHGRKGTGKSYLFRMFQSRDIREVAAAFATPASQPDWLRSAWISPGHGLGVGSPVASDFLLIAEFINSDRTLAWESFWGAYALLRLWTDHRLMHGGIQFPVREPQFEPYMRTLARVPPERPREGYWTRAHTETILELMLLNAEARTLPNLLMFIEDQTIRASRQRSSTTSFWLLFDNFEVDLVDRPELLMPALEGFFGFIHNLDSWRIRWLRPKVFLREDLWQRVQFPNKSHFEHRHVELRWERIDLLRLAYRLLTTSGAVREFLLDHFKLTDLDHADEAALSNALGLIWGVRRGRTGNAPLVHEWMYERMTDASGTTYPREMIHLLQTACTSEAAYLANDHAPVSDRLIRAEALDAGLQKASQERCKAIADDEYKMLSPFLQNLRGIPARGSVKQLEPIWIKTGRMAEPEFGNFVRLLETIGLLKVERSNQRYTFADIYIDGFGLVRALEQEI